MVNRQDSHGASTTTATVPASTEESGVWYGGSGRIAHDPSASVVVINNTATPAEVGTYHVPQSNVQFGRLIAEQTQLARSYVLYGTSVGGEKRAIGQCPHVERAEAYVLSDEVCLYLLNRISERGAMDVDELGALLNSPVGWLKLARLLQAGYAEWIGLQVEITESGENTLSAALAYARNQANQLTS